jgi:hypothetical protein
MKILNKHLNGEEKRIGKCEHSNQSRRLDMFVSSMLGNWEAAYKDFCKAQLSDFDEDVQTWCKEVETNVSSCLYSLRYSMCT